MEVRTETDDRNRLFFYEPGDGREIRTLLGRLRKYKGEVWVALPTMVDNELKCAMFPSGVKPKKKEKLIVLDELNSRLFMHGIFRALVFDEPGTVMSCVEHSPEAFVSGKIWDRTLILVSPPDAFKHVMAITAWKYGHLSSGLEGSRT